MHSGQARRELCSCPFSLGIEEYGTSTTDLGFYERDVAPWAFGCDHLPGIGGPQLAAGVQFPRPDRREFREVDVLGHCVPYAAAAHQLVPLVRSPRLSTKWRRGHRMDGEPPERRHKFRAELRDEK